jgi:hypothetical protein
MVYQNRQVVSSNSRHFWRRMAKKSSRQCLIKLNRLVEHFESFAGLANVQAGVLSETRTSGLLRSREG